MDTETNFVVTVGFTTKVDHQTTSKNYRKTLYTPLTRFASIIVLSQFIVGMSLGGDRGLSDMRPSTFAEEAREGETSCL